MAWMSPLGCICSFSPSWTSPRDVKSVTKKGVCAGVTRSWLCLLTLSVSRVIVYHLFCSCLRWFCLCPPLSCVSSFCSCIHPLHPYTVFVGHILPTWAPWISSSPSAELSVLHVHYFIWEQGILTTWVLHILLIATFSRWRVGGWQKFSNPSKVR